MKCLLISPTGREEFDGVTSIHLDTTCGERELLHDHVALIAALCEGPSIRLRTPDHVVRITVAQGCFIQFADDSAEVLTTEYTIDRSSEPEPAAAGESQSKE